MSHSKKDPASVDLSARGLPVRIELIDSSFVTVASGVGVLKKELNPGLYTLRLSIGRQSIEQLIHIGPEGYEDRDLDTKIEFVSSVPTREADASGWIANTSSRFAAPGTDSRIMLVIRKLGLGNDEEWSRDAFPTDRFEIWGDSEGASQITPLEWEYDPGGLAAVCVADVEGGGHMLRWRDKQLTIWSKEESKFDIDQSLWAEPGWATIVFLGIESGQSRVRKSRTVVYMVKRDIGFNPFGYEAQRIAASYENILMRMASGSGAIGDDFDTLLLDEKFANPMLGLIGAHVLLQRERGRWKLFDSVIRNLARLTPNHPDLHALRLLRKMEKRDAKRSRGVRLAWPPMLYLSVLGAIERDAEEHGALIDGDSKLSRVAPYLIPQGPWAMWTSIEEGRTETPAIDLSSKAEDLLGAMMADMPEWARATVRDDQSSGIAENRVAYCLNNVVSASSYSALQDQSQTPVTNFRALSRQTGLPVANIANAMDALLRKEKL